MNADQAQTMEDISRGIIECWTRIKKKARDEGRGETNIEKHAPCITAALNAMERFLVKRDEEDDALVKAAVGNVNNETWS